MTKTYKERVEEIKKKYLEIKPFIVMKNGCYITKDPKEDNWKSVAKRNGMIMLKNKAKALRDEIKEKGCLKDFEIKDNTNSTSFFTCVGAEDWILCPTCQIIIKQLEEIIN